MNKKRKKYDIVIVGAGISGTSLLYVLSTYTNVKRIAIIEKYSEPALVNSNLNNNSQTLHFGDVETNYTYEKAKKVKRAADMLKNYVIKYDNKNKLHTRYSKMLIAVGDKEVADLEERFRTFKKLFPGLKKINKKEIEKIEPNIIKGRDPEEKIIGFVSDEGYAIDFHKVSESFLIKAQNNKKKGCQIDVFMGTRVNSIVKEDRGYCVRSSHGIFDCGVLAVTAGAHSLLFAKSLGYGLKYALLCISGNFYFAPKALNGKVYTMQIDKLPFAAVHGDPEVHNSNSTRFGPTAKTLLMLERRNYKSVYEYFKTAGLSVNAIKSFINILSDWVVTKYILTNLLYEVPYIGKRMFLKEVKKIVPSMRASDIVKARGYGGVRPQIVNTETKKLEMGEAKIVGENVIFNITPSPGASTCLRNSEDDVLKMMEFFDGRYKFDHTRFLKDFVS